MDWLANIDWGQLCLTVAGSGALVAVLSAILLALINTRLKTHEEVFKARLSAVQREWEIRFTPYHQRRIEVLSALYGDLVILRTLLEELRQQHQEVVGERKAFIAELPRAGLHRSLREFSEKLKACKTAARMAAPFLSNELLMKVEKSLDYLGEAYRMLADGLKNGVDEGMKIMIQEVLADFMDEEILALVRESIGAIERPIPGDREG